jgi:hypothetical protein
MSRVAWIESLEIGLSKAGTEKRLVLLDFFNPN